LQENREARKGRGEWDYGKHSFHVCLHRGGRGRGGGGRHLLQQFFLLYVRSWERISGVGGKEGKFLDRDEKGSYDFIFIHFLQEDGEGRRRRQF